METTGPTFVCMGEQRCGTTWLYEALKLHPQISLPPMKAIRYFTRSSDAPMFTSSDGLRDPVQRRKLRRLFKSGQIDASTIGWFARYYGMQRTDAWYTSLFRPSAGQISGEICHAYSGMSVEQLRAMHDGFPNLKLIFLVREPLARSWSGLARRLSARDGVSIDPAWDTETLMEMFQSIGAIEKSNYINSLERILQIVPRENLHVGFHDQLRKEPLAFINNICGWLGLDDYDITSRVTLPPAVASAKYPPMPDGVRAALAQALAEPTERFCKSFSNPYSEAWHSELTRLEDANQSRVAPDCMCPSEKTE